MSLIQKFQPIKMILSDVDGVLTDGTIEIDHLGNESKRFSVLDGLGVMIWHRAGYQFGLVTGRRSDCVLRRAEEMKLAYVRVGTLQKREAVEEIATLAKLSLEEIAYIGDDLPDIPAIRAVGLGVTVPNAPDDVRITADYVTTQRGGYGAVRDLIEKTLKMQGKWEEAVSVF